MKTLANKIQIQFYGNVRKSQDENGKTVAFWEGGEIVTAVAYDVPIPGYDTPSTNNLRLWSSKAASGEFDFQKFNSGEYESSVADQQRAETISAVLYPNDNLDEGPQANTADATGPTCVGTVMGSDEDDDQVEDDTVPASLVEALASRARAGAPLKRLVFQRWSEDYSAQEPNMVLHAESEEVRRQVGQYVVDSEVPRFRNAAVPFVMRDCWRVLLHPG